MKLEKTNNSELYYDNESGSVLNVDDNSFERYQMERQKVIEFENMKAMISSLNKRVSELEQLVRGNNV